MDYIIVAILAALLNIILSLLLPCLLHNSPIPFSDNIKKVFSNNKQLILTSSVIVGILVYLALLIEPKINIFSNLANINYDTNTADNILIMEIN